VKRVFVTEKSNEILNKLKKMEKVENRDLMADKIERQKELSRRAKANAKKRDEEVSALKTARKEELDARDYNKLNEEAKVTTHEFSEKYRKENGEIDFQAAEDDFM